MALGENLIKNGFLTEEQLKKALDEQKSHPEIRIGEILKKMGFVTEEQIEKSLK